MLLQEIFDQLSHGELRTQHLGGSESQGIEPINYPKIVPMVQWALTEIYKKFDIKVKTIAIQQYEHIDIYELHKRFSRSNTDSTERYKYIMDTVYEPFDDSCRPLKIVQVRNENGEQYHLNDDTKEFSLYTPTDLSVQIPYNLATNTMFVYFRCNHPILDATGDDVPNQEVEISDTYLDPLIQAIGGRYLSTSGEELQVQQGRAMLAQFRLACDDIRNNGLNKVQNTTNEKAIMRGFP